MMLLLRSLVLFQSLLFSQSGLCSDDIRSTQLSLRSVVKCSKSKTIVSNKDALLEQGPPSLKRALELVSEKGASNRLNVLPVQVFTP